MSCGCENTSFYNSLSLSWLLLHTLHAPTLSGFNIYKPLCTFNSLDMYVYISKHSSCTDMQRQSYLSEIHCPQQFCLHFPYKVIM